MKSTRADSEEVPEANSEFDLDVFQSSCLPQGSPAPLIYCFECSICSAKWHRLLAVDTPPMYAIVCPKCQHTSGQVTDPFESESDGQSV